jgi:hypothetical protein
LDPNAFGTSLEGGGNRSLEGTTERDTTLELVSNAACKQCCVCLWIVYFNHIELDSATGKVLEAGSQAFSLRTAATDDYSGTTRVHIDLNLAATDSLDFDP